MREEIGVTREGAWTTSVMLHPSPFVTSGSRLAPFLGDCFVGGYFFVGSG